MIPEAVTSWREHWAYFFGGVCDQTGLTLEQAMLFYLCTLLTNVEDSQRRHIAWSKNASAAHMDLIRPIIEKAIRDGEDTW